MRGSQPCPLQETSPVSLRTGDAASDFGPPAKSIDLESVAHIPDIDGNHDIRLKQGRIERTARMRHVRLATNGKDISRFLDFRAGTWTLNVFRPASVPVSPAMVDWTARGEPTIFASYDAIARIAVACCRDGLALDSTIDAIAASGLMLARSQLTTWIVRTADMLAPVGEIIRRHGLTASMLCASNMRIGGGTAPTRRLWAYIGSGVDNRIAVWFRVTPDRLGAYAAQELMAFHGTLMAPTASGYDALFESGCLTKAVCWEEIGHYIRAIDPRRMKPLSNRVLRAVDDLQRIEEDTQGTSAARTRRQKAAPVLHDLLTALNSARADPGINMSTRRLTMHLLGQWSALTAFLDDGAIPLMNDAARLLRGNMSSQNRWVAGRYRGSQERSATMATIIETCIHNGICPETYIIWVLTRLYSDTGTWEPEQLTPWYFLAAQSVCDTVPKGAQNAGQNRAQNNATHQPACDKYYDNTV